MPLRLTKEQAKSFLSKYEDELQKFQSSMQHSIRHSLRCDTQFVPNIINALQSIANGSDFNPQVATSGMSSFKSLPEDPNACLTSLLSYNENSIVNFDHLIEFYRKSLLEQQKHLSDRKLQLPDFSKLAQFNAEINQLLGQKKSIPKDADLSEQLEIYSAKLQDTTGRRRLFKTDALIPQADKPRVAIKFSSKLQKEQFILNLIQEVNNPVYEQIKRDKLLKDIEKLFSTIEGQQHENILYIEPSSGTDSFGTYISHGKLAVNFGDQIIRNAFVKLTGLNEKHTEIYHSSKQNNALYFHAAKLPVEPDPNQRTSIQVQAPKYISYKLYAPENVDTVNDAIDCNGLLQGLSSFDHNGQLPNHIKTVIQQQIQHGKTEHDIKLQIAEDANNSRPILHADVLKLIENFLIEKKKNGSEEEKLLYANMSTEDFITRLLTKRPLAFYGPHDATRYRDGVPLSLKEYISYEEMQISAFLGVSSPSYFINDGGRHNNGIPAKGTFIERGVVVGQVGARFERSDAMEYQHMLITPQQNTPQNGYGLSLDDSRPQALKSYWAKFYGIDYFPTYKEAEAKYNEELQNHTEPKTYIKVNTQYLNVNVYKQRMKKVVETFLLEANARAAATNPPQKAYVHATGLGLGVWAIALEQQTNLLLEAYVEVLKEHKLEHIADIDFSWFDKATVFNGNSFKLPTGNSYDQIVNPNLGNENSHIVVHFSKNNPYQETTAKANKLLVSQYAWDSGSFPGNEFWDGALTASGDPAEACASGITYLQSSINPKVKGKYTMLAGKGDVLTRFVERDDVKKQPGKVVQAEIQEKEQHKQLICSQEAVKQDTLAPYINGLDCIDVTGDGNCFYYAVAAAFNVQNKELPQCSNQTLRQQVAEYIKTLDDSIVSALFIADKKEELQQEIYHLQSTIQTLELSGDIANKQIAEQRIEELAKEITVLDNPETNVALYASHKEAYINDIVEGKKWADGLAIDALSKALDRTIVVMGQGKTDG